MLFCQLDSFQKFSRRNIFTQANSSFPYVIQNRCFENFLKFVLENRSPFLIKLHFSILQHYWKKRFQCRCFLIILWNIWHLLYITPGDCFCFMKTYFTNKIAKSYPKKEKKWKLPVRKGMTHAEKNFKN